MLDDVSCWVAEGEICGLIGPNGAGKTTLFNCITGVNSLVSGEIVFAGQRIDELPARKIVSLGIARTFQNVGLYLGMSVLDNVLLGTHHLNHHRFVDSLVRSWAFDEEEEQLTSFCRSILRDLDLEAVADEKAGNLPFGTLKHVEIARALATKPKLLLLDEPAAGLNYSELIDFGRLINRLQKNFGYGALSTQYGPGDGDLRTADRASPRPQARGRPARRDQGKSERRCCLSWRGRMNILEVSNVSAGYGPINILRDIDFSVPQGSVVALLGANGAGKTTTLRAISGVISLTGSVRLDGKEVGGLSAARRQRSGIAHVPQGRGTFVDFTVEENLLLGGYSQPQAQIARTSAAGTRLSRAYPNAAVSLPAA